MSLRTRGPTLNRSAGRLPPKASATMVHVTRRQLLVGAGVSAATLALSGYATAYETGSALTLTEYAPRVHNWPENLELKIAVIADIHACYPWMSEERVGRDRRPRERTKARPDGSARRLCVHASVRFRICPARRLGGTARSSRGATWRLFDSWQSRLVVCGDSDGAARQFCAASAARSPRRAFRCSKINRCDCLSADGHSG